MNQTHVSILRMFASPNITERRASFQDPLATIRLPVRPNEEGNRDRGQQHRPRYKGTACDKAGNEVWCILRTRN